MDLKNLIPESDKIVVTLTHPNTHEPIKNEDGSEMTVTVYAAHSKKFNTVTYERTQERIKALSDKDSKWDADDVFDSAIKTLVDLTAEWNITWGGEKIPLSKENATQVYTEAYWIRNQLDEKIYKVPNFTKP